MQPFLNHLRSLLERVLQGTLPYDRPAPAESMNHLRVARVANDISLEFLQPEISIGPGSGCIAASFMSVPEAPMDEYHCFVLREHKIGGAGQPPHVKSISKAPGEKKGAKYPFRSGVLSANARHYTAALRSGRNAHGREYLPAECLRRWQLRAFARQCERIEATIETEIWGLPWA